MTVRLSLVGALALAALGTARPAEATFFSFASDVNSNAFTFGGTAGAAGTFSVTDFGRPNTFALLIDDDNGLLPTLSIPVEFRASMSASAGRSTNIVGNLWQHTYLVSGSFGFFTAAGVPLLTIALGDVNPAILTVPGSQTTWSSVGAVLGADTFSDVTYSATAALIAAVGGQAIASQYGIFGAFGNPADFGFDMTVIGTSGVGGTVAIDAVTKAPTSAWRSESSYSGSAAGLIPGPGAAALLGLGMLMSGSRRRR